jgi:hypothetical protein
MPTISAFKAEFVVLCHSFLISNSPDFDNLGNKAMLLDFLHRNRYVILYGTSLAGLLILLNWLKLRLVVLDHAFEVYIGFNQ